MKKILFVIFIGFILRFFLLSQFPYRLDGDAGQIATSSIRVWQDRSPLFATSWYGYHNLYFYINGFFIHLFKDKIFGLRFLSALGGALSILTTYLLVKKLFDEKTALCASFILSIMPLHLAYSRNGLDIIHLAWITPLILYFVIQGIRKNPLFLYFAGIFLGISQYLYVASRFIPLLVLFSYFVLCYKRMSFLKTIKGVAIILISALMVYGPMVHYFIFIDKTAFSARIHSVSILSNVQFKIKPIYDLLSKQIINCYSVFFVNVDAAAKIHYSAIKYLPVTGSILLVIGILYSFLKKRKTSLIIFFWLALSIFLGSVLTVSSPQPPRYVIVLPALSIFMAIGFKLLHELISNWKFKKTILFMFIILIFASFLYDYYSEDNNNWMKYDINTQIATFAARNIVCNEDNCDLYFLGNKNISFSSVPSLPYVTGRTAIDINDPVNSYLSEIIKSGKKNKVFIVIPERESEVDTLNKIFPHAKIRRFVNKYSDYLFTLIEVS